MIRRKHNSVILAVLMFALLMTLAGCGRSSAAPEPVKPSAADVPADQSAPAESPEAEAAVGRQDGERFEAVIVIEGMEEPVQYEHIRNDAIGFEMDYDYERFERHSEPDREWFVSCWDDPENPENYLELKYNPQDAGTVADAIGAALSNTYEISRDDSFPLGCAGTCIRIDASAEKGGLRMPDHLQMVYIIPAPDGCRVATAHYFIEGAEGFGRRFHCFMDSFSVLAAQGEKRISDERALAAVRRYCLIGNPDLESIVKDGEYPAYWELSSSGENEIVVLFRSYTGVLVRYYIDPISGETYVTEFVPGITPEEARTDESFNLWDYA